MSRAHTDKPSAHTNGHAPGRDAGHGPESPSDATPERTPRGEHPGGRSASIRWKVGSAAGQRVFGVEGDAIALELLITETGENSWSGAVRVVGDKSEPKPLNERPIAVRWQPDPELGLLHIDADGFVRATIDTSNGTPRLLYARSGVLGELGLDGGRYEPEGTELGRAG